MRIPNPIANTTTEAYLAYKAGVLEVGDLKPKLYDPYLHYDAWLAYWAGLNSNYPKKQMSKNLCSSEFESGAYDNGNGEKSTAPGWRTKDKIAVKPNTTYILSANGTGIAFNVLAYNLNGEFVGQIGGAVIQAGKSFTTQADCWYIAFWRGSVSSKIQLELGDKITPYEPYTGTPEILTDEEALVAYLSGVTNTYPDTVKDPEDVRIAGYLRYLVSARFGRPDYPVNNIEFYLSLMKPPIVTNETPSANIELDDTVEAAFVDVKMYGDTSQQTYSGKNLLNYTGIETGTKNGLTCSYDSSTGIITLDGTCNANNTRFVFTGTSISLNGTYTLSYTKVGGSFNGGTARIRIFDSSWGNVLSVDFTNQTSGNAGSRNATYTNNDIWAQNGASFSNFQIKVQLELGSSVGSFEPYVGGVPAPNPDYPQPVQTVTGRQTLTVQGKNLIQSVFRQGTHNNISDMRRITTQHGVFLPAGTTATVSYDLDTTTYRTYVSGLTVDGVADSFYNSPWIGTESFTFTAPQSGYYFLTVAYKQETSESRILPTSGVISSLQLEKGSTATTFEPYQSQEYEVNLGKNLLDKDNANMYAEGYLGSDGKWYHSTGYWSAYIPCQPNTNYVVSRQIYGTGRFGVAYSSTAPSSTTAVRGANIDYYAKEISVVTDNDAKYLIVWFYSPTQSAGHTLDEWKASLQIELGSTATSYAPYFTPIELCKIGDSQDKIYKDGQDWYLRKETHKVTYTGAETEWWSGPSDGHHWIGILFPVAASSYSDGFCSHFTNKKAYPTANGEFAIRNYGVNTSFYLSTPATEDAWRAWLGTHPMDLYYPLLTPTDTQITNPELIAQLNAIKHGGSEEGSTTITVTAAGDNLPGLLKVEAGTESIS